MFITINDNNLGSYEVISSNHVPKIFNNYKELIKHLDSEFNQNSHQDIDEDIVADVVNDYLASKKDDIKKEVIKSLKS